MIPIVRETLPELQMPIASALAAIGRERPHRYGEHDFPHDGKLREWEAEGRSRALTLMRLGVKPIWVGAQKRVMLGLSRLGRYGRQPERYARWACRLRGGVFLEDAPGHCPGWASFRDVSAAWRSDQPLMPGTIHH